MRILIYKRTHLGDPDEGGRFGIYNCMGRIRNYDFEAVIGVGGIGQEPKSFGIDRKINWVGVGAKKLLSSSGNGVVVTFKKKFLRLEEDGPLLESMAPSLARRMYEIGARILLNDYSDLERNEANAILRWALDQESRKIGKARNQHGCQSRCRPAAKTRGRDVT